MVKHSRLAKIRENRESSPPPECFDVYGTIDLIVFKKLRVRIL